MSAFPVRDLLAADALARGLLDGDPGLAGLVSHDPRSPDALVASARAAAARPIDRPALVATVLDGLDALEAPPVARAAAARLGEAGTVVVVAGQQPGLLGGTLLVLVKALAAAAVAERLTRAGVPAVPVFWSASEDHDHDEADHVGLLRDGAVERLSLALPGDRRMLSHVPVPAAAAELVRDVLSRLPAGPGRALVDALLPPREGQTFGTWTGRLLAAVLGRQGIVVVEPRALRALAAPVVAHEHTHPGVLRGDVERALARVTAAGYAPPLELARPELWFDVDAAGRRVVPDAAAPPSDVSWNVVSRVLAQDLALPVAAQVCGPAEAGYVALLREAHERLGIPQPAALVRPGATLVDPPVRRACEGLGVDPAELVCGGAAAVPAPAHAAEPGVTTARAALEALPEGASKAARRRRAALLRGIELYAAALRRDAAEADAVRARRLRLVTSALRPLGRPQERVLSFLPWYAEGGDPLVTRLRAALGDGAPLHHVIRTEDL